jgi:predicted glycosyltransferase involved in capsule biosynthesis
MHERAHDYVKPDKKTWNSNYYAGMRNSVYFLSMYSRVVNKLAIIYYYHIQGKQ